MMMSMDTDTVTAGRTVSPVLLLLALMLPALLGLGGCGSVPRRADHGPTGSPVADIAASQVGIPYRYGGTNPARGFDCSGLVSFSYRQAGLRVPRTADSQYLAAQPVPPGRLRPGDLVFFALPRQKALHVGIYTGRNEFVHAPSSGKRVSYASLDDGYWRRHFIGAGRFLP